MNHESDLQPFEDETSDDSFLQSARYLAEEEMADGASNRATWSTLVESGLDEETATNVVTEVAAARSEAIRERGRKNTLYGMFWFVGGLVVTVGTYAAAFPQGGTYLVAWGAIAAGVVQMLYGFMQTTDKPRAATDDRTDEDDDDDDSPPGW